MKVLFVINALGEGGTETSTAQLLPALRDRGVDSHVAILRSRGDEGVEGWVRENGFPVNHLPQRWPQRVVALRSLIERTRADVVHSALFEADLAARLARRPDVPLLTSLVSTTYDREWFAASPAPNRKLRIVQAVDIAGTPLSTHFHAVSQSVKDDAIRNLRIDRQRITVVHRGRRDLRADRAEGAGRHIRAQLGIPPESTVLVTVGRHEPQKDLVTLVRAVGPLLKKDAKLHLVLAGRAGTATPSIHEQIERFPDNDRVHVLGHRPDVAAILDAADVFVTTSRYEGLPGAVIEAMSMGLPVIGTDIAPIREVLGDASLAPPGDVEAFGALLQRARTDAAWRRSSGDANRARFERRFGLAGAAAGMEHLYRTMASEGSSHRRWRTR